MKIEFSDGFFSVFVDWVSGVLSVINHRELFLGSERVFWQSSWGVWWCWCARDGHSYPADRQILWCDECSLTFRGGQETETILWAVYIWWWW
jgi:hypothetical protein